MRMSEQCDKIAAALVAVSDSVRYVGKSGENTFDKYSYAKLDDYVRATSDALRQQKVCVLTSVTSSESLPPRKTKSGNEEQVVRLGITMRAIHESGQWAEVDAVGEGQDRSDKAIYKANTGARKYAIAQLFGLATSDNAEEELPEPKPQREVASKPKEETPGQVLVREVAAWSGLTAPTDVNAAARGVMAKAGVVVEKGGKLTAEQAKACGVWMSKHRFEELN